jgi:hypothetical protein
MKWFPFQEPIHKFRQHWRSSHSNSWLDFFWAAKHRVFERRLQQLQYLDQWHCTQCLFFQRHLRK